MRKNIDVQKRKERDVFVIAEKRRDRYKDLVEEQGKNGYITRKGETNRKI